MRIIEIVALDNGAHRNQTSNMFVIPDGWAVIPDGMETENFPFGTVTVEEVNGVMAVTSWTPGTMPEPEPVPEPGPPTTEERVAALEAASDRLDAQATYTAMMTDTLMEG